MLWHSSKKKQHNVFAGILQLFHSFMFDLYMEPKRTAPRGSNPEVPGIEIPNFLAFFLGGDESSASPSIMILEPDLRPGVSSPHGMEPSWLS